MGHVREKISAHFGVARRATAPGLPFLCQLHWIITPDPTSEMDVARLFDAASGGDAKPANFGVTPLLTAVLRQWRRRTATTFGRKRETVDVLSTLARASDRLPVLIGNSGVGKSSWRKPAGAAALGARHGPKERIPGEWPSAFQNSRRLVFLSIKPGTDPLKALVASFLDTWQFQATDFERIKQQNGFLDLLREGKATLPDLIDATERRRNELDLPRPPGIFLYVDQGEELYVRSRKASVGAFPN